MTGQERRVPEGRLAGFDDVAATDPSVPAPSLPPRRPATRTTTPVDSPAEPVAPSDPPITLKGVEDKVKPSNVHVSVELVGPFSAWCERMGLSHGEGIIYILEATSDELPALIKRPASAGGSLFQRRDAHPVRPTEGPRTPLNYRMRAADFAILDQLVEQFGATSRGHLISTAITAHLKKQTP